MILNRLYLPNFRLNVSSLYVSCVTCKNHYEALRIAPGATQADIKSAYYKLSKIYHPDKNKGCLDASKKFQDISNAYEILGNFKLRKLYDKGLLHTRSVEYAHTVYPDHPEAKFYRSRETRHTTNYGTPVYDFDEWAKAHYGATFERRNRAKQRWEAKQSSDLQEEHDIKNEKFILLLFVGLFIIAGYSYMGADNKDRVRSKGET